MFIIVFINLVYYLSSSYSEKLLENIYQPYRDLLKHLTFLPFLHRDNAGNCRHWNMESASVPPLNYRRSSQSPTTFRNDCRCGRADIRRWSCRGEVGKVLDGRKPVPNRFLSCTDEKRTCRRWCRRSPIESKAERRCWLRPWGKENNFLFW